MLALAAVAKPPHVELTEVAEPSPAPSEALVGVEAFSLNRGESKGLASREPGTIPGWDVAGRVVAAAADGSGPAAGTRIVGIVRSGAWAERVAVPTASLVELPDAVSSVAASTLPVAGLTALKALDVIGTPIGRRVLVTGANGGVGRFAIQLARIGGAHVTALVRDPEHADGLRALGADDVITAFAGEFDGIVEGVGGATLGGAIAHVAPGGTVVSFASTDTDPVSFATRDLFGRAPGARVYGLFVFPEVAGTATQDLGRLVSLLAHGKINPQVEREVGWRDAGAAIAALLERTVGGKVVLRVGD